MNFVSIKIIGSLNFVPVNNDVPVNIHIMPNSTGFAHEAHVSEPYGRHGATSAIKCIIVLHFFNGTQNIDPGDEMHPKTINDMGVKQHLLLLENQVFSSYFHYYSGQQHPHGDENAAHQLRNGTAWEKVTITNGGHCHRTHSSKNNIDTIVHPELLKFRENGPNRTRNGTIQSYKVDLQLRVIVFLGSFSSFVKFGEPAASIGNLVCFAAAEASGMVEMK
ncbi:hypothetical protein F3Y22_tig00110809pilonHSYRG00234 [Hibiscus syriacus]|uniref:Uncharacterized protein n=1 Tax=Hibiscus syriacus TaxID=106335 RepID=A0A6A2ZP60_HIBSY|nr:hypothetical protein F3Y22_tig00110809pilonHSYRG00234 [Hibiscus syriacus]